MRSALLSSWPLPAATATRPCATSSRDRGHYPDAYESQALEIAQLKAKIAELEKRDCR